MTDDLTRTLREIVALLERLGLTYMAVGSIAALAHGRMRTTADFDVVVELDAGKLSALLGALPEERFYVSESAAREALVHQSLFNVIDLQTGWKVDFVPRKRRAFSREELSRRLRVRVLGVELWAATVEDTILAKLEWAKAGGSARQQEDVRELIGLAGPRLDRAYLRQWAPELDITQELEAALNDG